MGYHAGSAGNISIALGGTETLSWLDGSSVTTGARTIASGGVFTLYRRATDDYYIWGSGIS